jgi:hypothetical protein
MVIDCKTALNFIQDKFKNYTDNNFIEPIYNFSNENDPYRQKVIRTIKKFLSNLM